MAKQQVVSVGDTYEMEAIRLNDDGEGVVSIHGFTVFVPGLLPGEQGSVEIRSIGKSFARGKLVKRMSASENRIEAPCPVFDRCGGCQLQHISYQNQLLHKQQTVEGALRRVGKFKTKRVAESADLGSGDLESADLDSGRGALFDAISIRPVLGMDDPWRYRNHVQVPIRFDGRGSYEMGFYAPGSHTLVPAEVCLLEPLAMEQTAGRVAAHVAEHLGHDAQAIHHLILRYSFSSNEMMVVLSMEKSISLQTHAHKMLEFPYVASVAVTVQPNFGGGSVWGREVTIIAGESVLTERLKDVEYRISPRSFFQVNPIQTTLLYEQVAQSSNITAGTKVLDAYCGTGTIALWLARSGANVTGIESIEAAVGDARLNAEANRLKNAVFVHGKVEKELPRLLKQGTRFDVVVVDPPRKGVDRKVLDSLLEVQPKQIVYVSCNPSTLARDLRILADNGYQIGTVQPVDMFPQTAHVECVVSINRPSSLE